MSKMQPKMHPETSFWGFMGGFRGYERVYGRVMWALGPLADHVWEAYYSPRIYDWRKVRCASPCCWFLVPSLRRRRRRRQPVHHLLLRRRCWRRLLRLSEQVGFYGRQAHLITVQTHIRLSSYLKVYPIRALLPLLLSSGDDCARNTSRRRIVNALTQIHLLYTSKAHIYVWIILYTSNVVNKNMCIIYI